MVYEQGDDTYLMRLKSESVFVISAITALSAAVYLALLSPYILDWSNRTLILLLASCLLIGGMVFSVCYLFYEVISQKLKFARINRKPESHDQ